MAASEIVQLDAQAWKKAMAAGANALAGKRAEIDALNVFPVPDGDTGTNMSLTIHSAAKEAIAAKGGAGDIAKAASSGALRGARGNSGVILSQLFRGFAKGLGMPASITTQDLARAMAQATQMAYTAVMKPREGTILTVARGVSERAAVFVANEPEPRRSSIGAFLDACIEHGRRVLLKTPELLPELKAAGVVDSGGEGYITMWEGIRASLDTDGEIALWEVGNREETATLPISVGPRKATSVFQLYESEDIRFPYDTELFIHISEKNKRRDEDDIERELFNFLDKRGDSIVLVVDDGLVKVHVHTDSPGAVLDFCMGIGDLSNIKIENMREQHSALLEQPPQVQEGGRYGSVAVTAGSGFSALFRELGVGQLVEGGQTMNPSAEDILRAAVATNAEEVFVLPNNSNIILAAQQAAELAEGMRLHVLQTRSMPEGIAAMVTFVSEFSLEDNLAAMQGAISGVRTGQVTYAVRDTEVDGRNISKGDILGILDSEIVSGGTSIEECAMQVATDLAKGCDILSIYAGEDTTSEEAQVLHDKLVQALPNIEIELHRGEQPLYYYIFSAE